MYPAMSTLACAIFYLLPLQSSLLLGWLVLLSRGEDIYAMLKKNDCNKTLVVFY